METKNAVDIFASLAQETRLRIFRLLAQGGPEGMAAGEIARALDVPNATLSFHLAHLTRAGLLQSHREGRSIGYAVNVSGMQEFLAYLTEDCCQGRPELCGFSPAKCDCAETATT